MTSRNKIWQIPRLIDGVIFDCDGTLSSIEGIDELAQVNGVFDPVQKMTQEAMDSGNMDITLYRDRLQLAKPTQQQLQQLGQTYIQHVTQYAKDIIACLQRLQLNVYVLSAGLTPGVAILAKWLGVPDKNVFAVDVEFNAAGDYHAFDESSVLVSTEGKQVFVKQFKQTHPNLVLVGDGMNDLAASDEVLRFIGFGGHFKRKNVAIFADFYVTCQNFAPLLPLILSPPHIDQLTQAEQLLYQQGLEAITNGFVLYREPNS